MPVLFINLGKDNCIAAQNENQQQSQWGPVQTICGVIALFIAGDHFKIKQ